MAKINPKDIVMTFVLIIIGASLVGPVGETVFLALHNYSGDDAVASNVTGAGAAILGLLTLFFVIFIIMIAVKKIRS